MACRLQFWAFLCLITIFKSVTSLNTCPRNLYFNEDNDSDPSSYRLPKEVVPISYNLTILTKQDTFAYDGIVEARLKVLAETGVIILHSDNLIIKEDGVKLFQQMTSETNRKIWHRSPIVRQCYDPKRQFYVIAPAKALPNEYLLIMKFRGEIRDDVFGFYRSSYVENGETKWMGVTQFSPTYARRAFPCMDEPHFKAVFELNIGAHNKTVISNTKERRPAGSYMHKFVTPVMATYQVGWAVHDFVSEAPSNSSGNFQMWTRKSMNHRATIALNQSKPIFPFLDEWLQVGNPISKMDQIAVPDFNFHAMENWGMITYRESVVLYEDGGTPTKCMIDGLSTMTHEYAHTWFGNLVTPVFWDVAWLKEGFASYFQYYAVSRVYPEWRMMDKFVVDTVQPALLLDSVNHTRSMNGQNVGSPSSIMAVLDFVSYDKAASIIRMISHVIGERVFQNGLQMYLKNKSFQAATPSDLYKYLHISINISGDMRYPLIEDVMDTWANQSGYPLVTVSRDYETQTITVCQESFGGYRNKSSLEWWIPLNSAAKTHNDFSCTEPRYWLKPGDMCHSTVTSIPMTDWVIYNIQQTGYYRVNYDGNNWRMLTDYLKSEHFQKIHLLNRAALIDDAFNLARWGYIGYAIPFNLSNYLTQESDYEPWVAAVNNFRFLNKMLSGVPVVQRAFQKHATDLLQSIYEQLTFSESKNEDVSTKLLREIILSTSCLVRSTDCLFKSNTLFKKWIHLSIERIPKDVKSFVYCEGIRNGSEENWYTMLARWQNTDLQTEQDLLLRGLGCTQTADLINEFLELAVSGAKNVRKQQRMIIINAAIDGNAENVDYVLKYVELNLAKIIRLRGHDFLSKILTAIGKAITRARQTEMLEVFIRSRFEELGSALDSAEKALSTSMENVKWVEEFAPRIADYFRQFIVR